MNSNEQTIRRAVEVTRRRIVRWIVGRRVTAALAVGGAVLVAAAAGSRLAPAWPWFAISAWAFCLTLLGGLLSLLRVSVDASTAAEVIDRASAGAHECTAAWEVLTTRANPARDDAGADALMRAAVRRLDSIGVLPRPAFRVEWWALPLLLYVAALSIRMLPQREDAAPSRVVVAAAGDAKPSGAERGATGARVADETRSRDDAGGARSVAETATAGGSFGIDDRGAASADGRGLPTDEAPTAGHDGSGRGEPEPRAGGDGGGASAAAGDSDGGNGGIDELFRRLGDGSLSANERDLLLRSMERGASGPGGEGPVADADGGARTDRDGARTDPTSTELWRLRRQAAAGLADLYPTRYRDVVSRYFDPRR